MEGKIKEIIDLHLQQAGCNGEADEKLVKKICAFTKDFIKAERERTINEIIILSDKIENENETTFEEWKGFKHFRNRLREIKSGT